MRTFSILLIALLIVQAGVQSGWTQTPPAVPRPALTPQQWEVRIKATSDNSKAARSVILDGILANETLLVAQGYERLYNEKPTDKRLGIFGYAAVVAESYRHKGDQTYKTTLHHAADLLEHAAAPEDYLMPEQAAAQRLKRIQDANAWLAWGRFRLRAGFDVRGAENCYRQALKLDPDLAEACWWLAELAITPFDRTYFKTHADSSAQLMARAERLEPKLHPFALLHKASLELGIYPPSAEHYARGQESLQAYLEAWPANPHADVTRGVVTQLDATLSKYHYKKP